MVSFGISITVNFFTIIITPLSYSQVGEPDCLFMQQGMTRLCPQNLVKSAVLTLGVYCLHTTLNLYQEDSCSPINRVLYKSVLWLQTLDEPGEDTSRFDTLMPTVVRPPEGVEPPIEMFPGVQVCALLHAIVVATQFIV